MKRKKWMKNWITMTLSLSLLTASLSLPSTIQAAETQTTIQVNAEDGTVTNAGEYDGPQVEKIRVLTEDNYLEIYWDRYVDENEAIDVSNFILKNGNTTLYLEAKGTDWTNTLYFDKNNQEIAATSANSMARLDSDLHMSSISFYGTIDPSKEITLEIIGDTIVDKNGKSAQSAVYSGIPYLSFYTQSVVSDTGILVKADNTVAYSSLEKAAEQIDVMLSKTDTGIAANMADYQCSLAVYSPHQNVYLIPEHRYGFNKDMYDVEGYGGSTYNNCVSSIAEQNILRTRNNTSDWYMNTMYRNENILIHEFGHCVKSVGMDLLDDQTLRNEFLAAYNHAVRNNLWPNTYCISNEDEFFATMCTIWFNVMDEARNWNDGTRGPVNTRYELQQYDPHTYDVFAQLFPDVELPSPWNKEIPDSYHDETYDPDWKPEPEPAENKKELKKAITRAELLDSSLYADSAESILEAAVTEAQAVYYDEAATQLKIDLAAAKLTRIIETLPPIGNNFAINAVVSTSHVSTWENLEAVNDGLVPPNSFDPSIPRYGTWGNTSEYETVTYTWDTPVTLNGADIYLWYDGTQNNYTSGGIKVPKKYFYEYLDTNGNWQTVANPSAYETAMDVFNKTTFDKVTTSAIRVTLMKQAYDGNGIGVMEWKVYGEFAGTNKTELEQAIKNAETLKESDYTAESWKSFQEILSLAKEVNEEEVISLEEMQLVLIALATEQANLIQNPRTLPYKDVTAGTWYYEAVYDNYFANLMTGKTETEFAPNEPLTRAQFALILYRIEGEPEVNSDKKFDDVSADSWYTDGVLWAYEKGIITGYANTNKFGPHDMIMREQMAVMMYRYAKMKDSNIKADADLSKFTDAEKVGDYAVTAMKWAVGNGIITGKNAETLDPRGNTLRAEAAVVIHRFIEK